MKRTVEVNILNQRYKLKTTVDEKDLAIITALLNERIEEIKKHAGTLTTSNLAILSALYMTAENYFVGKKIESLIEKISKCLGYSSPEI